MQKKEGQKQREDRLGNHAATSTALGVLVDTPTAHSRMTLVEFAVLLDHVARSLPLTTPT
jgi:hypothetical protein